jgi:hypothetical protein
MHLQVHSTIEYIVTGVPVRQLFMNDFDWPNKQAGGTSRPTSMLNFAFSLITLTHNDESINFYEKARAH